MEGKPCSTSIPATSTAETVLVTTCWEERKIRRKRPDVLDSIFQDIRRSVRLLRQEPAFAAVALLTLALGTGVSVALFCVIDAALLRPLRYPHPEQLISVRVLEHRSGRVSKRGTAPSLADVRAWNAAKGPFGPFAIALTAFFDPIFDAGVPERVRSLFVTDKYFELFGAVPPLGRAFEAADMASGAPRVLLISNGFWRSRFGSDPGVVGRTVRIDGSPGTIIGVLPPGFGGATRVWQPLQPPESDARRGETWDVFGRLTDPGHATAAAAQLTAYLPGQDDAADGNRALVKFLIDDVRSEYRATLTMLTYTVGIILVLACVNVAGLTLARGAARQRELAVRASMGASRTRLVRQGLTESFVLSAIGGLLGVGLAWLTLDLLVANLGIQLPDDAPAGVNLVVLAASLGVMTLTALLAGLVPAIRLSCVHPVRLLVWSDRQRGGTLSRRGGQLLIGTEVALAVITLAGAGLMLRSFSRLISVELGFDPTKILAIEAQPVEPRAAVYASYYPPLVSAIRRLPGVEAVGAADSAPLGLNNLTYFLLVGKPGSQATDTTTRTVVPGYFEAFGITVVAGRGLTDSDMVGESDSIMINERAARRWFANANALGQVLEINKIPARIVGVTSDTRTGGPEGPVAPEVFRPFRQNPIPSIPPQAMMVIVRSRSVSPSLVDQIRRAATSLGPRVVIDRVRTGSELFGETIDERRQRTVLLSILGGFGVILAAVGVLGVTSFAVARRTHEIGTRMALGAQSGQVVLTMLRDAASPIAVGVAAGTAGALFATKIIRSFLFETSPTDPVTLAVVATTVALIGCGSAWIPARRAARVDPVQALRSQ
jgi:putative ABC transport system permease protein